MKLTSETKILLGMLGTTALIILIAVFAFSRPVKPIPREKLVPPDAADTGNKKAAHYLVEFSDFQCPACGAFYQEVDTLAQKYRDRLLVVYRHFPLPQHENAMSAAIAAEAAGKQGKFWQMADLLFANQENLSEEKYSSLAAELKLDLNKFNSDRKDPEIAEKINSDISYGDSIGINATPTFYLDGIKLNLNSPADLAQEVEMVLK